MRLKSWFTPLSEARATSIFSHVSLSHPPSLLEEKWPSHTVVMCGVLTFLCIRWFYMYTVDFCNKKTRKLHFAFNLITTATKSQIRNWCVFTTCLHRKESHQCHQNQWTKTKCHWLMNDDLLITLNVVYAKWTTCMLEFTNRHPRQCISKHANSRSSIEKDMKLHTCTTQSRKTKCYR